MKFGVVLLRLCSVLHDIVKAKSSPVKQWAESSGAEQDSIVSVKFCNVLFGYVLVEYSNITHS